MKNRLFIVFLIVTLLCSCTPAPVAEITSTPVLATVQQPSSTPSPLPLATATKKPKKNQTGTPAIATEKPKNRKTMTVPTSTQPGLIAPEILGRPTDHTITINTIPSASTQLYYEYGLESGKYTFQTSPQTAVAGQPLETLIEGLQPNTRYYYSLRYGAEVGEEGSFMTQRSSDSSFTFAVQGDSHPERVNNQFDQALYTRTLLSAASVQPDFFFCLGDDFSVDTLKSVTENTVTAQYIQQRAWLGLVGAPVFLVNGNHEQAALANLNGTAENVAVWAQNARNAYYPQPAPDSFYSGDVEPVENIGLLRDYYAFTWGDALFVVIDPYWHSTQTVDNTFGAGHEDKKGRDLWNITLGETQYRWFRETLENSDAAYKFVFAHHVNGTGRGGIEVASSFEWGDAAGLPDHRPGWDKTIHQIMVDSGVTIFFQGHDHIFARQTLDGVIYQTLPEPAHPLYTYENAEAYLSGDIYPNSGHVRVSVSPEGVLVEYIRSFLDRPDELAFSYRVPPVED